MKGNFRELLPKVLVHEGGYVDDPQDPGGETNKGITHKTYDAWRKRQGQPTRSVKHITPEEVAEIYRQQYWNKIAGDDLPSGVDYAVFDFAVNSGPSRAAQFLQRAVGVADDGIIGAQTLAAVDAADPETLAAKICDDRLSWLKRLKTFKRYGRGWTRRVQDVRRVALAMIGDAPIPVPTATVAPGKTGDEETKTATVSDLAKDPKAWGAGAGLVTALAGVMEGTGPVQWAFAAAIVIGVAIVAVRMLRK